MPRPIRTEGPPSIRQPRPPADAPVIVSVTPTRLDADSRTLKQAASFARFGYRSIVVEGEPSELPELVATIETRAIAKRTPQQNAQVKRSSPENPGGQPGGRSGPLSLPGRLKNSRFAAPVRFAGLLAKYIYQFCVLPLRVIPEASLYYLHGPYQFPAVYLHCKRHGARFIYDAHDFYSGITKAEEITNPVDRWMNGFYRWLEARCIQHAAAVVTVSDGIAALQREAFGCDAVVMRNVHDHRLDRAPKQDIRSMLGLSPSDFLIVTVGQAKDGLVAQGALTMLASLPSSTHLAFLGRHYEKYQGTIDALGVNDRVHLITPVKPYEVVPLIQSADVALIPYFPKSENYVNCLPNGFFQAIGAGQPLLYPRLAEIERLAEQHQLGLPVDPRSAESLRAGVLEMMDDDVRAGYKRHVTRASAMLNWEHEEKILLELVHSHMPEGSLQRGTRPQACVE